MWPPAETRPGTRSGEHLYYLFNSTFPLLKKAGDLPADRAMAELPSLEQLRNVDPEPFPGGTPDCRHAG